MIGYADIDSLSWY